MAPKKRPMIDSSGPSRKGKPSTSEAKGGEIQVGSQRSRPKEEGATKEKDFEVFIGRGKNLFSYKKNYNEKWVECRNTRYQLTQTVRERFAKNPETRDLLQRYDEAWTRAEPVCQT
ncbi:unnamed protein product [Caenorhabditis brenneri]